MTHLRSPEKRVKRWLTWIEKRDRLRARVLNTSYYDDELRENIYTDDSIFYYSAVIGEVLMDTRGRGLFQNLTPILR